MKERNVESLLAELKQELSEWVNRPSAKEDFYSKPTVWFEAFCNDEGNPKRIIRACERSSTWHLNVYEEDALNQDQLNYFELALSAKHACWAVLFNRALVPVYPGNPPVITMDEVGQRLAYPLLVCWKQEAALSFRAILDVLQNNTHASYLRHPWFMLHLFSEWQGIQLDIGKYDYPDSLEPYDQALMNWKTTDMAKLDNLVSMLAEFHLQEAYESEEEIPEFSWRDWWVFPYEILAMLRLREFMGLENPKTFTHPLMQLPINRLPPPQPISETPLLDKVIAKFRLDYPDSLPG